MNDVQVNNNEVNFDFTYIVPTTSSFLDPYNHKRAQV